MGSVWEGSDADLLERLLSFYPRKSPERILNATVNGGRLWRGSQRPVVGMDIEAEHRPMIVADNTCMPFYVHDHQYQWAHVDFLQAAGTAGFRPCDCIIKIRKGPIINPKWKVAHHSRRQHCYWLIFRKSDSCE